MAELSWCSDPVDTNIDLVSKLVEVNYPGRTHHKIFFFLTSVLLQAIYLAFSENAAAQGCANRMKEKLSSLDTEAKRAGQAEEAAEKKA